MKRLKQFMGFVIVAVLVMVASGCLSACNYTKDGTIFGTFYSVEFDADNIFNKATNGAKIQKDWEMLESLGSTQVTTSDVYRINSAKAGEAVTVSEFTANCFKLAVEYNALFPEFNPAIYPLVELWKFSPDTYIGVAETIPSDEEIQSVLEYCTLSAFTLDEGALTITKSDSRAKLDFGAFLKGVAVESAKETLAEDCTNILVNLGGTIYSSNTASIAVANPRGGDYRAKVEFTNAAVATSGNYERYYLVNGKRYHHIIGTDGYPAGIEDTMPITSVTVVGPSATICDILSTAVFIKGVNSDSLLKLLGYSALILTDISAQVIGADNATWTIL